MSTIGFKETVRALHEERQRQLRTHPTLDELHAYNRGSLSADQQQSLAEHLAVCDNCSILLLYEVIGPTDDGSQSESFEDELEEVWGRIRPHLEIEPSPPGRSLAELQREALLPLDEALSIAQKVCQGIARLNARGRVLSDLRPENIFLAPSGQIRILDFGPCFTPESLEVGYGQSAEDAIVDMYRSLSPEQVAREGMDERSNLFSFGVLLYEMMTGDSPFRDSSPLGTASRILSLDPTPASELNPEVGPSLSALIDRLLEKDPEDRPPSASAVARELESIADASRPPPRHAEPVAVEDQIERLYNEIIALTRAESSARGSSRADEVERAYARLLELQTAEAKQYRERFEASLNMPIDAGERILARARALREELEDLAPSDPAAQDTDKP